MSLLSGMFFLTGCTRDVPEEITEISLKRCLTPSGEGVSIENDVEAVFYWTVLKEAESYNLEIALDEEFSSMLERMSVTPQEVPVRLILPGPGNYYYHLRANSSVRESSHWTETHKIKIK